VAQDNPDRAAGSWNQAVGSGKEMLGNMVGADGLKHDGIQQNQLGKGQEAKGQLSDVGAGMGTFPTLFIPPKDRRERWVDGGETCAYDCR